MKKIIPIVSAAALAVTLSACGGGSADSSASQNSDESQSSSQELTQSDSVVGGTLDAALTAIRSAEAEVEGSQASEIDFEDSENEWEVTVLTESASVDVHVHADGESVIKTESPGSPDSDDWTRLADAQVDFGTALKNALNETAGTIDEAGIDDSGSATVWEVDIYPEGTTESLQLLVDTQSGEVTEGD